MNWNIFQWQSLKTRVTLITLSIFVVGMWSLVLYASWALRDDMQRLLGDQQFSTVSLLAEEINEGLESRLNVLETVAGQISPAMLNDPALMQNALEERRILPFLFNGGFFVTRLDGTAIADVPVTAGRTGVDFKDRDYIVGAIAKGKATIGKPLMGPFLKSPLFVMAVPVRDARGKVIGALAGVINLGKPNFLDKITDGRYGKTGGYLLIAPQHNLFVTAVDKSRILQPLPAQGANVMHDKYMAGFEGYGVAVNSLGVEELTAAKGIPVAGWFIVTALPTAEAFSPIYSMQRRMLLAALLLTLLAGGLTWGLLRRQLLPLLAAVKALATQSDANQPTQPLPVTNQDEIGLLISAFNRLLKTLEQRESAREEALDRLQKIAGRVPGVVFQLRLRADGSYCLPYASEALRKIYRINPDDVREDASPLFAVVHPDDLPEHLKSIGESAEKLAPWHNEYRLKFEGEPDIWLLGNAMPQPEEDGSVLWHGFVTDVTERKRDEAELIEALKVAKLSDQTKDAFLANMSHELRTPLNAVIGMAGLARSISSDAKLCDYLDKIVVSGKHLNRIVNDLLDLSKIAAGHMAFEVAPFSLRGLLQHCNSVMAYQAAEKGLKLDEVVDAAVPDGLMGDPHRIEQILLNLLGNAIKFTSTGQVKIHVSLHAREEDLISLDISVEDTGIGMRAEDQARLFKPFSQVDSTVSRQFGGTGLGLAISKQLAGMMGGDITVSSRQGIGTTFNVRIRLGLSDPEDLPVSGPTPDEAPPDSYENVRILVAEDQPLNREIVEVLLSEVGITSRMAENGQEVLDILRESGPDAFDLVLMDIQMPVMDGLSATRALRSRGGFESLPIIAMTAHTMAHEKEISIAAGMNDHIGKPFDNTAFYRTLAKWIPLSKHKRTGASVTPTGTESVAGRPNALSSLRCVDVPRGLANFNGKEDRYRHWLADFVETAGALPGRIRADIAAGRTDAAAQTVHAFKGRVGILGMTELHGVVSALDSALRDGASTDELLLAMERSIGLVRDELMGAFSPQTVQSDVQGLERMVWSEAYSVKVADLDEQHRKLLGMVNRLADCHAARNVGASETFREVLSGMFDYVETHFKAEEEYLRRIGYPRLGAHEKEHAAFAEKMISLNLAALEGVFDSAEAHRYLREWLLAHILKSDMQYRHFVEENNPAH